MLRKQKLSRIKCDFLADDLHVCGEDDLKPEYDEYLVG